MMAMVAAATALLPVSVATSSPSAAVAPTAPTEPLRVETAAGPVVGRRLAWRGSSIDEFLGVPYAAPPAGDFRWRPPQPVEAWTAPRPATKLAPPCPQNRDPGFGNVSGWSEDCLYVNVWAPSNSSGLPVLLWLHGGGWQVRHCRHCTFQCGIICLQARGLQQPDLLPDRQEGSAAQPLYNGRNLTAARDVVLVVVGWRVNVFGFFGLQALAEEEEALSGQRTSGFYGQQDQRAAMVWVQQNAARFGGDKDKVSLWGQSAGASSICYHMLTPRSKGLFSRAIIDSSCDELSLTAAARHIPTAASFAGLGACGPTNISCLRGIPAAALNAALNSDYSHKPYHSQHWFYPAWDPSEWPAGATSMMGQWSAGKFANPVPTLIGSTLEESAWEFCGNTHHAPTARPQPSVR